MILGLRSKKHPSPSKEEIAAIDKREEVECYALDQIIADLNEAQNTLATLNAVNQILLAFISKKQLDQEFEAYCSAEAKEAVEQFVEQYERGSQQNVT